jgi:hypothetical protein
MALFWRIWTAITLVNAIVVSIFVALATTQFGSINAGLVGERLIVLADRTVAPFAATVRLGLPLTTVRNANAILERARQTDADIIALHVFDADGVIVHSTASPAPERIPPGAAAARASARSPQWVREMPDGFMGSVDIRGRDGSSAGGILVVYPGGGNLTQVRAMFAELVLGALVTLLLAATLGGVLLRTGLAGAIRRFEAIDSTYRNFERGAWRRGAGLAWAPSEPDASELREQLEAAAARYRAAGHELTSAGEGAQ